MTKSLPTDLPDNKLWQEFKKGNIEAFNLIYKKNFKLLFSYGYNIFADKDFIKDNLQELLFEIWRDKKNLGDVRSIKVYLLISFRRKVLYNLNKHRKILQKDNDLKNQYQTYSSPYEETLIEHQRTAAQSAYVKQLLEQLPARQKEAIFLRYYQDLPYDEIMKIMSLKYQTVRDLIYKAIKSLRLKTSQEKITL